MRNFQVFKTVTVIFVAGFALYLFSCNSGDQEKKVDASAGEKPAMSKEDMIKRGDYIVTTGSCHDCHSPKNLGPHGEPFVDSSRMLAGHPADGPMPALDANAGKPGGWLYFSPDLTAYVGAWGITYSANLTPDSATGIGAWTEEQFIQTLRTGKHLGNGRDLMPPMPWNFIGKLSDDDLRAVFTYLNSLKAVSNRVHAPITPPEMEAMKAKK
jgi:mono/diheme cytochrome c family protein